MGLNFLLMQSKVDWNYLDLIKQSVEMSMHRVVQVQSSFHPILVSIYVHPKLLISGYMHVSREHVSYAAKDQPSETYEHRASRAM